MILNGKVDHYTINHFECGKKKFCAITYLISAKHLLITYLYHFYDIEINLIITLSIFNVPNFFCQKRSSSSSIKNMKTQWGNTYIAVSLIISDNEILVDELVIYPCINIDIILVVCLKIGFHKLIFSINNWRALMSLTNHWSKIELFWNLVTLKS